MIVVLEPETDEETAMELAGRIESKGLQPLHMPGEERTVLGAIGDERVLQELNLESHPAVEKVTPVLTRYKLVNREFHPEDTVVELGDTTFGGDRFTVIAGPCSIEGYDQMRETAEAVVEAGASALRGGAYKPRTSPYSFQGLGAEGLDILDRVCGEVGVPAFTEVMEVGDVERVAASGAGFQIGSRNMQNSRLLKAVGQTDNPVLLKRGMSSTIEEFLLAAEYIVSEGNSNVVLCERGIKTFADATRYTLDMNAVPVLKSETHLPVVVDPSHGTGVREYVRPMARSAVAAGADGLIVEVHPNPEEALSDGQQSLYPEQFDGLMDEIRTLAEPMGREVA